LGLVWLKAYESHRDGRMGRRNVVQLEFK
jgi:hypothetical protein